MCFVHMISLSNTYSSNVKLHVLYGHPFRLLLTYIHLDRLQIFLAIGLHGVDRKERTIIRVGALTVIWSLWLCRNDKVFNDKDTSLLQVLYRCTGLLRSWSTLQRVENRGLFMAASARLELTARDIFIRHGWPSDLRIEPSPP